VIPASTTRARAHTRAPSRKLVGFPADENPTSRKLVGFLEDENPTSRKLVGFPTIENPTSRKLGGWLDFSRCDFFLSGHPLSEEAR
jgi:hypothetical protein